jgi:hypothetical protein
MAATFANTDIISRGKWNLVYTEMTLDSSYATSGEAIAAAEFGMKVIKGIWASGADGYTIDPVRSSDTAWLLKVFGETATTNTVAAEMVSGKDLSSVVIPLLVLGR